MCLPNLVIAGAPKCGTSSLFKWLSDHPHVCGSRVKEAFYLMDKGHPLLKHNSNFHDHGLEGYKTYFKNYDNYSKIILESTTHYMYQKTALDVLSRLEIKPQIIFVLRKPSSRIYSSFQYTKNNLGNVDKNIDFSQFIRIVKNDSNDSFEYITNIFAESAYVLKNDIKYSKYIEYITPWVKLFGKDKIYICLFEDMKRDPLTFTKRISEYIGLDPAFYQKYHFPVMNETLYIKSKVLHRQARRLANLIPPNSFKNFLKAMYRAMQVDKKKSSITQEDRATLEALDSEFLPFNKRLADEFDIDISAWE